MSCSSKEILAFQHFKNFQENLKHLNSILVLLDHQKSRKKKILNDLRNGTLDILIGTHAVLEDNVVFLKIRFCCN